MKFGAFVDVLSANGFVLHRQGKTSHAIYRGEINGRVQIVVVAAHRMSDDIAPGTLASMIRQSGLPRTAFK